MKATLPLTVVLLGGVCLAVGIENRPNTTSTNQTAVSESEKSQDEKAIQAATAAFVKAYNAADATAIAALFTEDAESIDEDGKQVQGRQAIQESFAETFEASPGAKMEIRVDSQRFLSPDVVKEEGRCTITPAGKGSPTRPLHRALREARRQMAPVVGSRTPRPGTQPAGKAQGAGVVGGRMG